MAQAQCVWREHLEAMRRVWLVALLLLVPLAAAHHKPGHDGGPGSEPLIQVDLDPDDRDDDRDEADRDDREDDREEDEEAFDGEEDDGGRSHGRQVARQEEARPRCLQLSANATKSGNAVAWEPGQATSVYRAAGKGDFHLIHEAGPDEVLLMDRDLKKGTTYRYQATTGGAADCPVVEVTAVPYMGQAAGLLAGAAAVAGYAFLRRP